VRQGVLLGTAFHPELTRNDGWHRLFARMVAEWQAATGDVTAAAAPADADAATRVGLATSAAACAEEPVASDSAWLTAGTTAASSYRSRGACAAPAKAVGTAGVTASSHWAAGGLDASGAEVGAGAAPTGRPVTGTGRRGDATGSSALSGTVAGSWYLRGSGGGDGAATAVGADTLTLADRVTGGNALSLAIAHRVLPATTVL